MLQDGGDGVVRPSVVPNKQLITATDTAVAWTLAAVYPGLPSRQQLPRT